MHLFLPSDNKMEPSGDVAMETNISDSVGRGLPSDGPMGEREEPLGSVNGKPEVDDKENNNGSTEEPLAVRCVLTHTHTHLTHQLTAASFVSVVIPTQCCSLSTHAAFTPIKADESQWISLCFLANLSTC